MPTISSFNPIPVKFTAQSKEERHAEARQILADPNSTPEEVDNAMLYVTEKEARELTKIALARA